MKFNYPPPSKWSFWITVSLILKFLLIIIFYSFFLPYIKPPAWIGFVLADKDFADFYNPVSNFIHNGVYEYVSGSGLPYTGRLPGFVFPVYFILLFFKKNVALHIIVGIQIAFSALAAYLLARITEFYTHSLKCFFITWILFLLGYAFIQYDITFHPDSYTTSAFITGLYFLIKYRNKAKLHYLFLTGLFFTWACLMRPYLLPYLPALAFVFGVQFKTLGFSRIALNISVLLTPILLFEVFWTFKNYQQFRRFIPLIQVYSPQGKTHPPIYPNTTPYSADKLRDLIASWGGDNIWYQKGSEMNWFAQMNDKDAAEYQFSDHIFCSAYNRDSLNVLRTEMHKIYSGTSSPKENEAAEVHIIESSERYKTVYRREHWARYLFISPLLRIRYLIFRNPVQDWPGPSFRESSFAYKVFKLVDIALYFIISSLAFPSLLYLLFYLRHLDIFELSVIFLYLGLLFVFAFLINLAHITYFFTGFVLSYLLIMVALRRVFDNRSVIVIP